MKFFQKNKEKEVVVDDKSISVNTLQSLISTLPSHVTIMTDTNGDLNVTVQLGSDGESGLGQLLERILSNELIDPICEFVEQKYSEAAVEKLMTRVDARRKKNMLNPPMIKGDERIIEWEHFDLDLLTEKEQQKLKDPYMTKWEDDDDEPAGRVFNTPFGPREVSNELHPFRRIECWMLYTNFRITEDMLSILAESPGIEIFIPHSDYRVSIGLGVLFDVGEVKEIINDAWCCKCEV